MQLALAISVLVVVILFFLVLIQGSPTSVATQSYSPYGTYELASQSACQTPNGLCTEKGKQMIVERCIINPKTNRGCLNGDGVESYQPRLREVVCQPPCYSYVWSSERVEPCVAPSNLTVCAPPGTIGTQKRTKTCTPRDGFGTSICLYQCGSLPDESDVPICQSGKADSITLGTFPYEKLLALKIGETTRLWLAKGYMITERLAFDAFTIEPPYAGSNSVTLEQIRTLDTTITYFTSCTDYSLPKCGTWMVKTGTGLQPCTQDPIAYMIENCFIDINPQDKDSRYSSSDVTLFDPSKLFEVGYTSTPMECVNPETGATAICLPPENSTTFTATSLFPSSFILQQDPFHPTVPGCAKSCLFFPDTNQLDLTAWDSPLAEIVGKYTMMVNPDDGSFLSLHHSPCNTNNSEALLPGGTGRLASDCYANPLKELEMVEALFVYPGSDFWPSLACSEEEISSMSSLVLFISPYYTSTGRNRLDCNVFAVFGGEYLGWLDVDAENRLFWRQAKKDLSKPFGWNPETPNITIYYDALSETYRLTKFQSREEIRVSNLGSPDLFLNSVKFKTRPIQHDGIVGEDLLWMQNRQSRCLRNTCNLYHPYVMELCNRLTE